MQLSERADRGVTTQGSIGNLVAIAITLAERPLLARVVGAAYPWHEGARTVSAGQQAVLSRHATGAVSSETSVSQTPARRAPARIIAAPIACRTMETRDLRARAVTP